MFGRIIQVVRAGSYLKVAAQFAGVSEATLRNWLAKGRAADAAAARGETLGPDQERYRTFLVSVSQAETQAEVSAATHWRSSFEQDWRACRDYLRYRHPDRWRAVTAVSLSTEEAEGRIDRAVWETLTALGLDAPEPGGLDPATSVLLAEFGGEEPVELEEDDAP